MILLCMLLYKWKQINYCLLSSLFSFIQFLGWQTIFNISSTQPFLLQRGCGTYHFSSRASTADKTCSHRPPFQNQFPDQRVKGVMRTPGEIDFRFRLNLKITLVESTYPSQRPQCPSLSPHFLLIVCVISCYLTKQEQTDWSIDKQSCLNFFFSILYLKRFSGDVQKKKKKKSEIKTIAQ